MSSVTDSQINAFLTYNITKMYLCLIDNDRHGQGAAQQAHTGICACGLMGTAYMLRGHFADYFSNEIIRVVFMEVSPALFIRAETWKSPKCTTTSRIVKSISRVHTVDIYAGVKNHVFIEYLAAWARVKKISLQNCLCYYVSRF